MIIYRNMKIPGFSKIMHQLRCRLGSPTPLFNALSWKPGKIEKRRSRNKENLKMSSIFSFHNQRERVGESCLGRFYTRQLTQYENSKFLFNFETLSPDGVVLEAQKKAFTRA